MITTSAAQLSPVPDAKPALVRIQAGQVHVWTIQLDLLTTSDVAHFSFPDKELDRARQITRTRDRHRFLASRLARRDILSRYHGVNPMQVRIERDEQNRPRLAHPQAPGFDFNLSHSGKIAMLAISQGALVGVDIERQRTADYRALATRSFLPAEAEAVINADPQEGAPLFFRYWTCKEAYLKATGVGLVGLPGPHIVVDPYTRLADSHLTDTQWTVREIPTENGYAAALATQGIPSSVVFHHWRSPAAG